MQKLYRNGLEHLYDTMYQTFIDYDKEFDFYNQLLLNHNAKSVLEIGCGTGNLAKRFLTVRKEYVGLDLSEYMVNLSKSKNPNGLFIQGNITDFELQSKVDAAIITGRTTSYLFENKDLNKALETIHKNLNEDGLLIFDFIDASRFFKIIGKGKEVTHLAHVDHKKYSRDSFFKVNNAKNNFMFDWKALYYEIKNGEKILLTEDDSTVRAFTKEEWGLLLYLNNFRILECINRESYAFDTFVILAQKI